VTNGVVTQAGRQHSRRAALGASFRYASALYTNAFGCSIEPHILEQLEIEARLERVANDAMRRTRDRFPA
jgi:hypothetical protein